MNDQKKGISPTPIAQMLFVILIIPFLPLLITFRFNWWEAWTYAIISILGFIISRALAVRKNPDLLAERAKSMQHEDTKKWDKVLAPIVGIGSGLIPLVAGLDARFEWSERFSLTAKLIALAIILLGYIFSSWALIENRFFSGVVRIQSERGHKVISTGPYRLIRHPGYAGALPVFLAIPVFLDSIWAFAPAVFITVILIIRTRLEDKTLQDELDGYREYTAKVRYLLIPGVW